MMLKIKKEKVKKVDRAEYKKLKKGKKNKEKIEKIKRVKRLIGIKKSLQDLLPDLRVSEDGIFLTNNLYSKMYYISNVNYLILDEELKEKTLIEYRKLLNQLNVRFKINVYSVDKDVFILNTISDDVRKELIDGRNALIADTIRQSNNNSYRRIYTISIYLENDVDFESVKNKFLSIENSLEASLKEMDSYIKPLNTNERMKLTAKVMLNEDKTFNLDNYILMPRSFKDFITPNTLIEECNYLEVDGRYFQTIFIDSYKDCISDNIVNSVLKNNIKVHISINAKMIDNSVTTKMINSLIDDIELKKHKLGRRFVERGLNIIYPKFLTDLESDVYEISDDVASGENLYLFRTYITIESNSIDEMQKNLGIITSALAGEEVGVKIAQIMQIETFKNMLPFGIFEEKNMRTMITKGITGHHFFSSKEILDQGGTFYGINKHTKEVILANKNKLPNKHGLILGSSGVGKGVFTKLEIIETFINTNDKIIIIDSHNEYKKLCDALNGTYISLDFHNENYINIFDIADENLDLRDIVRDKEAIFVDVCKKALNRDISTKELSLISLCIEKMYVTYFEKKKAGDKVLYPTLNDFYEILQNEKDNYALDKELYIFVKGSLDLFNHNTNINTNNRFTVYGLLNTDRQIKKIASTIMISYIEKKVFENMKKGKNTWIYIEEIQEFFKSSGSAELFTEWWKKMRKFQCGLIGITQDIDDILDSDDAKKIFNNSEWLVLLKQSNAQIEKLHQATGISEVILSEVPKFSIGEGLLKMGNDVVIFNNYIYDKSNIIYQTINTD